MPRPRFKDARTRQRGSSVAQVVAFLVLTGLLTFFITVQIARVGFGDTYRLTAVFTDASGLMEGDKVKIAGTPVGQVGTIRIRQGKAEVELKIAVKHRVPEDSEAAIRWRDAIGQRVVYLMPGTEAAMLRDGDRVGRTRSVVDLSDLINRLEPLARGLEPEQLNTILLAIYTAMDGTEDDASRLLANVDRLSSTIAGRKQTLRNMLDDFSTVTGVLARRDQQIARAADDLATLTEAFGENRALVDTAISRLSQTLRTTDEVAGDNADELDEMIERLSFVMGGTERNLGLLKEMLPVTWPKFQHVFELSKRGGFLVGSAPCIFLTPSPCPDDMRLTEIPEGPMTSRSLNELVVGGN